MGTLSRGYFSTRQAIPVFNRLGDVAYVQQMKFIEGNSVNTSKSYITDMTWPILTRLGHKYRLTISFMSYDQTGVKGHVGVTGVKKVIFTKNATPPTYYVAWSCDLNVHDRSWPPLQKLWV